MIIILPKKKISPKWICELLKINGRIVSAWDECARVSAWKRKEGESRPADRPVLGWKESTAAFTSTTCCCCCWSDLTSWHEFFSSSTLLLLLLLLLLMLLLLMLLLLLQHRENYYHCIVNESVNVPTNSSKTSIEMSVDVIKEDNFCYGMAFTEVDGMSSLLSRFKVSVPWRVFVASIHVARKWKIPENISTCQKIIPQNTPKKIAKMNLIFLNLRGNGNAKMCTAF
jgi:hypothetical protein